MMAPPVIPLFVSTSLGQHPGVRVPFHYSRMVGTGFHMIVGHAMIHARPGVNSFETSRSSGGVWSGCLDLPNAHRELC